MSLEILRRKIREKHTKEDFLRDLIIIIENSIEEFIDWINKQSTKYDHDIAHDNIQDLISKFTGGQFLNFNSHFFTWIKNTLDFNYKKIYTQNTLNYINIILDFFQKIEYKTKDNLYSNSFSFNINHGKSSVKIRDEIFNSFGMKDKIDDCGFYLLNFNFQYFIISFSEEKEIIKYTNVKSLDGLFASFRSSKTSQEKKLYMNEISIKVRPYFSEKEENCKKQLKILNEEMTEEKRKKIKKYLNGYFLHDEKEKRSPDAKEWDSFSEEKRNEILEWTFIHVLYSLAILRLNNLLTIN